MRNGPSHRWVTRSSHRKGKNSGFFKNDVLKSRTIVLCPDVGSVVSPSALSSAHCYRLLVCVNVCVLRQNLTLLSFSGVCKCVCV